MERDFYQLQARAPRNEPDLFRQVDDALELTTLNGVSGTVQLERVRWRLEEGRLYRDVWPVIDSPADVKADEVPIVSEVKSLAWRFYRQGWQKSWSDPAHLPDGVELTLSMENGDTWRWVCTCHRVRRRACRRARGRDCAATRATTCSGGETMSALRKQKGVALLVVLILLVMMSALAAKISQQFCRNLQKTHYQVSQQQLRWAMQAQEKVVKDRLQSDASGESNALSPEGDWQQPLETQGEDYTVVSQVEDAQDCFNVNNLLAAEKPAQGQAQTAVPEKPRNERIVEQILTQSGLSQSTAEEVYLQLVDYLDGDTTTAKEGAESDAWAGVVPARQPANQMMRTIAEIKLLPAFPAAAYPKVSKLLCALPDTASKVDVNTLKPEQAALLAALFPAKLTEDDALRLIESRPESGWENMETFSKALEQTFPQLKDDLPQVAELLSINSRYFRVNYTGNTDELTLRVVSQLQVNNEAGEIVTWQRRYRMIE